MFKNWRSTIAWLFVLASALMVLSGCEGDKSTENNNTDTDTVKPTATVIGQVQDTNGNFIAGAKVTLGKKTTTTNAGGQYQFDNVPVVNSVGADGTISGNPLPINIDAPAGYLDATVTVYPQAQFDGTSTNTGVWAPGNIKITLVSGSSGAGTAVLPKLESVVTGTLRNCSTGAPIANQQVSLDLQEIEAANWQEDVNQQQPQDGVRTSYATPAFLAVTGADGTFTITGVPDDAELRFVVGNYEVSALVDTTDEDDVVNVGTLSACKITSTDSIKPFIKSVNNVIGSALCVDGNCEARATLRKGIDGTTGIVVTFSEPMATITADDVVVRNVTTNTYVTGFTFVQSSNTVTITFATALPEGTKFDIIFDSGEVTDLAGNMLLQAQDLNNDQIVDPHTAITYDFDFNTGSAGGECQGAACGSPFVKLCLKIFASPSLATGEVAMEQLCDTATYTGIDADLHELYSSVFVDVECEGNECGEGFQQLNFQDAGTIGADPEIVLTALSNAFGGSAVQGGVAQVNFTPITGVDAYTVGGAGDFHIDNNCGPAATACCDDTELVNGIAFCVGTVWVADTDPVELIFHNVTVGNAVTITPLDDLGYAGVTSNLVLEDCVEPTVVLQKAYGVCNTEGGTGGLPPYGSGAELADEGVDATLGVVLYPVTPRMLGRQEALPYIGGPPVLDPPAAPSLDEPIAIWNLYGSNVVNTAPTPDVTFISSFGLDDIYDATSFNAFPATTGRRVGLAVSENLASASAATFTGGTAVLSDFALMNNVVNNDDTFGVTPGSTNVPPADLVLFNVNNVLTLANVDHAKILDMTGAMTDTNGLSATADANAKAKVQDRMPAFVDRAYFTSDTTSATGLSLFVDFNEAIAIPAAPNNFITLVNPANNANTCQVTLATSGVAGTFSTLLNSNTTLRIPYDAANWCAGGFAAGVFFPTLTVQAAVYAETSYDDIVAANTALPHGILNVDQILDTRGNSWNDWTAGGNCTPEGIVDTPVFAAVNALVLTNLEIGGATVPAATPTANPATGVTLSYTANLPIDWALAFGTDYNATTGNVTNGINPATCYVFFFNGAANVCADTVTVSADKKRLTAIFGAGDIAAFVAGNFFDIQNLTDPATFPATTTMLYSTQWTLADPATPDLDLVRVDPEPVTVQ